MAGINGFYFIVSSSSRRFCVGICREYLKNKNRRVMSQEGWGFGVEGCEPVAAPPAIGRAGDGQSPMEKISRQASQAKPRTACAGPALPDGAAMGSGGQRTARPTLQHQAVRRVRNGAVIVVRGDLAGVRAVTIEQRELLS